MLKVKNYEIKWNHENHVDSSNKMDGERKSPWRGSTICEIYQNSNGKLISSYYGVTCCSWDDNFSYETGRKIALARAMRQSKIPKKDRTAIWESYRFMGNKQRW